MQLKVKKIKDDAKLPTCGHPGDAGLDLYAYGEYRIPPLERIRVDTGIALEIPNGYVGLVWDKSSLAFKSGLKVLGGVVDASYRGEVFICLFNTSSQEIILEKGQKVAQILIQKFEECEIVEINDLTETVRGEKWAGSTGHK